MLHVKLRKHIGHHKVARPYLQEEMINQMIQIEGHELYDRVNWVFGGDLAELLAPGILETKELN